MSGGEARYCGRCGHRLKPGEEGCHPVPQVGADRVGAWACDTFTVALRLFRGKGTAPVIGLARALGWRPSRVRAAAVPFRQPHAAAHSPLLICEDWGGGMLLLTRRGFDALSPDNGKGG